MIDGGSGEAGCPPEPDPAPQPILPAASDSPTPVRGRDTEPEVAIETEAEVDVWAQLARDSHLDDDELVAEIGSLWRNTGWQYADMFTRITQLHARESMQPVHRYDFRDSTGLRDVGRADESGRTDESSRADRSSRSSSSRRWSKVRRGRLNSRDMVIEEIAANLLVGRGFAGDLVDSAAVFVHRLPTTLLALRYGDLDLRRAMLVAKKVQPLAEEHHDLAIAAGLSPAVAEQAAIEVSAQVEQLLFPRATNQTHGELSAALDKAVITVDPGFAERRRANALLDRDVTYRCNDDGTTDLWARLGAADAQAVYTIIDGYARFLRQRGDERTLAQLRADTLTHLILHGHLPDDAPAHAGTAAPNSEATSGTATGGTAVIGSAAVTGNAAATSNAVATGDTVVTGEVSTGGVACAGPVDSVGGQNDSPPREAVIVIPHLDSLGRLPALDPATSTSGTDDECEPMASATAAAQERDDDTRAPGPAAREPVIGHDDRSGRRGGRRWEGRNVLTNVNLTCDVPTMLGLAANPAYLEGHGPITPQYAQALAFSALPTAFRRLITDKPTGQILDFGRTTYRPPAALADHVRARDQVCQHPGCNRPAVRCELDHIISYPLGTTCASNLHPLCKRHHRMKHEGGWRHERSTDPAHPPNSILITSPAGVRYLATPPPTGPYLPPSPPPADTSSAEAASARHRSTSTARSGSASVTRESAAPENPAAPVYSAMAAERPDPGPPPF